MPDNITKEEMAGARLRLYGVMIDHVGPENKIGMGELYTKVFGKSYRNRINDTKALRTMITEMRRAGHPVMSSASRLDGGYWLAASAAEINDYCDRSRKRALLILAQIARIKKVSLPEYLGQLQLELFNDQGGES